MMRNKILVDNFDSNNNVELFLANNSKPLRENEINYDIDANDLYHRERNNSAKYKLYGKIKMIFRNQFSGTTNYRPLLKRLYLEGDGTGISKGYLPYDEFAFIRRDATYGFNNRPHGTDLINYNPTMEIKNRPDHVLIGPMETTTHNWGMCLTYVFDKDSDYVINYTFSDGRNFSAEVSEGIPFRVAVTDTHYILTSPVEHHMSAGEYIVLSTKGCLFFKNDNGNILQTTDTFHRTFKIESIGNNVTNSEKYVINIDRTDIPTQTVMDAVVFGKRCIDKNKPYTTSQYYVRKHKVLTEEKDYTWDKLGFETNIWEHERKILFENAVGDNDVVVERNRMETIIYNLNDIVETKGLKNNHNQTPNELYVTIFFKNGNGYFNYPPKVGYKFNFHNKWVSKHFEGNTNNEGGIRLMSKQTVTTPSESLRTGYLAEGDVLYGDMVEYNKYELKETVISSTFHKITARVDKFNHGQNTGSSTFSGVSASNPAGLYYRVHYEVKLREESPYIETSDEFVDNLPENSTFCEEEKQWRWRDLYDLGYVDENNRGLNYPFMNGNHYVKTDINFYLRNELFYTNKTDETIGFKRPKDDLC